MEDNQEKFKNHFGKLSLDDIKQDVESTSNESTTTISKKLDDDIKKLIVQRLSEKRVSQKVYGCGFSLVGSDHVRANSVCQDSIGIKFFDNCYVYAVSDGHGSAKYSEFGSKFAIEALFDVCRNLLENKYLETDFIRFFKSKQGIKQLLKTWVDKILEDAETKGLITENTNTQKIIDHYGATLLFCIVVNETVILSSIGDGAILLLNKSGDFVLPFLSDDEDIGESTLSLSHVRTEYFNTEIFNREDYGYILMSTDGIGKPYRSSINSIAINCTQALKEATFDEVMISIEDFMIKSQPQIGDDISLVFGVF